jgi:hypothetical protein
MRRKALVILFSENDCELVEVNVSQLDRLAGIDVSWFGHFKTLEPRLGSGFCPFYCLKLKLKSGLHQ